MLFLNNLLLFTTAALAVNVIIFIVDDDHNCPANETVLVCNDIDLGICCTSTDFTDFPTLQVAGLSTVPNAGNVAIAFSQSGDNRCGVSCDTAFAENNACLSCVVNDADTISGGGWNILPRGDESTESLSVCTGSVEPDELKYQGRSYNIYHDVPASISAQLVDLVRKNVDVADFPAHLSQYEKKA
ncbi:hypothetical protein TGAM01_v202215 [Trichoderma gamsii]|uniref:Uncharacterized protein n=1 Tax=Trichoderma gamsii TaxID=398673 RepID=A0A2P4ZXT3_9HYPO|nr:hypothetical protein TGAM01_v202215 [Trichoderma gamsii]PON29107.1 hypothetical protein TGAM01_v202215 [Trichoderma gamsii]